MSPRSRQHDRGFSLLELLTTATIMSIIAAVITPIILASSDAYVATRDARADTERVLYALDRVGLLIREIPWASDDSGIGITTADPERLVLESGAGLRLTGTTLEILDESGAPHPLCADVEGLELVYFDESGRPMSPIVPTQIHRIAIRVTSGGVTLSTHAMPRAWIWSDSP